MKKNTETVRTCKLCAATYEPWHRQAICKPCHNAKQLNRQKKEKEVRDNAIKQKFEEGMTIERLATMYSLSIYRIYGIVRGTRPKGNDLKELKSKLKEYRPNEAGFALSGHEAVYEYRPEKKKPQGVNGEVVVKKLSDYSLDEQKRMLSLFGRYKDTNGKTVQR